jgi:hypothetical protein
MEDKPAEGVGFGFQQSLKLAPRQFLKNSAVPATHSPRRFPVPPWFCLVESRKCSVSVRWPIFSGSVAGALAAGVVRPADGPPRHATLFLAAGAVPESLLVARQFRPGLLRLWHRT